MQLVNHSGTDEGLHQFDLWLPSIESIHCAKVSLLPACHSLVASPLLSCRATPQRFACQRLGGLIGKDRKRQVGQEGWKLFLENSLYEPPCRIRFWCWSLKGIGYAEVYLFEVCCRPIITNVDWCLHVCNSSFCEPCLKGIVLKWLICLTMDGYKIYKAE